MAECSAKGVSNGVTSRNKSTAVFQEFLKIRTDHPEPDYAGCTQFLLSLAKDVGLPAITCEPEEGKPFVVMSWIGSKPDLPSVFLYCHTDVVPAYDKCWTHPPFEAEICEKGNIYARGTQDMKSVGIQYIEAIRNLKRSGVTGCLRTIHVVFGPDEEIGGFHGMGKFVDHPVFKDLNVGFVLDEGVPWPDDVYRIYYGERCLWPIVVKCTGTPGHGSRFIENNAAEKFRRIVNSFLGFRDSEFARMTAGDLGLGEVTSVNLTKVEGGVQINVVPAELYAHFDIRIPPTTDFEAFEEQLETWMKEAGPGVSFDFEPIRYTLREITKCDESNPWWLAIKGTLDDIGAKYKTDILGGGTDSRFLRKLGIPCLHFSPMIHTPNLLHDHDEFINEKVFLDGISIFEKMIPALANVKDVKINCEDQLHADNE